MPLIPDKYVNIATALSKLGRLCGCRSMGAKHRLEQGVMRHFTLITFNCAKRNPKWITRVVSELVRFAPPNKYIILGFQEVLSWKQREIGRCLLVTSEDSDCAILIPTCFQQHIKGTVFNQRFVILKTSFAIYASMHLVWEDEDVDDYLCIFQHFLCQLSADRTPIYIFVLMRTQVYRPMLSFLTKHKGETVGMGQGQT